MLDRMIAPLSAPKTNASVYALLGATGLAFFWLDRSRESILPFWAPWEFSWIEFLAAWLALWWYIRGLALSRSADLPSVPRQLSFFVGIFIIYAVLETHFEYLAEHQFFLN